MVQFLDMNTSTQFAVTIPSILLPKEGTDYAAWSCIACDQFTQDREYWAGCEKAAENKPSTLHITLPEVYLNDPDKPARIEKIKETMKQYSSDVFADPLHGFVYIERTTAYGRKRKGLVAAIDLETYEWKPFSTALIRATEATIVDRIPPRMEIRRGAAVETPHIMLLVNDPEGLLVEASGARAKKRDSENGVPPLYDTKLMMNGGSITGWAIESEQETGLIFDALKTLKEQQTQADGSSFLFAVGDGNHSLATAKAVWDEYKAAHSDDADIENHPARFALVEIVNIYDDGLTFEPIHRVMFNTDIGPLTANLCGAFSGRPHDCGSEEELADVVAKNLNGFGMTWTDADGKAHYRFIDTTLPVEDLLVSHLQPQLDSFLKDHPAEIDYIHGTEEVFRLAAKPGALCLLLPPIAKESFFSTIAGNGPLPRKSFSMGEATEKRYYLECRKLFG